ncbi:MAG: hypothetical protein KGL19_03620, partial [Bacteroidota bacterium]|nr:hypothetical protein [Bacteroidota bacterium]
MLFISVQVSAWKNSGQASVASLTIISDTVPKIKEPVKIDSLNNQDTTGKKADSASLANKIDTLTISKDSLDAPVAYTARDSGVLIIP